MSKNYPGSSLAVIWREEENNRTILNSSRDAIVTPGAQVAPGDEQRISMLRRAGPIFELTIRQVQIGDSGKYSCVVVEWLQDPQSNNNWFDLPPARTTTELNILEQGQLLHCYIVYRGVQGWRIFVGQPGSKHRHGFPRQKANCVFPIGFCIIAENKLCGKQKSVTLTCFVKQDNLHQ